MKFWIIFFSVVFLFVGTAGCRKLDSLEGGSVNNGFIDEDDDDDDDDWESLCTDNCKLMMECDFDDADFDSVADCTDECLDSIDELFDSVEFSECESEYVVLIKCHNKLDCDEIENAFRNCSDELDAFMECVEDNMDDDDKNTKRVNPSHFFNPMIRK